MRSGHTGPISSHVPIHRPNPAGLKLPSDPCLCNASLRDETIGGIAAAPPFTVDLIAALRHRYRPGNGRGASFSGWIEDVLAVTAGLV